jgi:hypothetical protein
MTPDEFEKIKAEEKAHLREMRRLKGMARSAEQKGRVASAFSKIVGGSAGALDALEQAMSRVGRDTAMDEARFEIATEGLDLTPELDDEALRAERARALVAQMKGELSAPPRTSPAASDTLDADAAPSASSKTLGRTPPVADSDPDVPAAPSTKTLGRRT